MNNAIQPSSENPSKLTEWANEPSLLQLKQDYESAKIEADRHALDVDKWVDNLNLTGSAKIKTADNRSSVQPKTIRKQAEWRYSSLSEPFLSTPDIFNVYPKGHLDKESAYQNQLVLNHQFNNQIDKVALIDEYVRTAVDEGTVVARVGWEYEEEQVVVDKPVYELIPITDPALMQQLEQLVSLSQTSPQEFAQVPEDLQLSVQSSMERNAPLQAVQVGTEEVTEIRVIKNQPTVDICDYRNVVIDPTCNGNIYKAKFGIYEFETSLDELRKDGRYSNLDEIKMGSILGDPDYNSKDNASFNFQDKPRAKLMAYEYWGFWDYEDTGMTKPFVATWVGNTMIRMEESPFPFKHIPFVNIPFMPKRKSLYGEPDGELIEDNQKIIGAVTRGMIDILASNANGQRGNMKGALDTANKRKYQRGEDYEFNQNSNPQSAFYTHAFADIPPSAQFMLQQQNFEAESMSGVKAFSQGISGNALGESVGNGRGALDAASKRELGILRRLAHGLVKIGRMIVAMNAEFLQDEEIIRVTDEDFVAINREELAGEFDLRLTISTVEEDNAKAQELAFMLQTTGNSMDAGMTNMILAEIARLRKMPDLAKRIETFKPQPDPRQEQMVELELQLKALQVTELQAKIAELNSQAQLNMAKAKEAGTKGDLNNLDFLEQESGVKQERDLQKQQAQAAGNAKLEMVKKSLERQNETAE